MKTRHAFVYVVSALALFLTACPQTGSGEGGGGGDGDEDAGDAIVDTGGGGGDAGMDTETPPDDTETPDDTEPTDTATDTAMPDDTSDMDGGMDGETDGGQMNPAGDLYYFTSGGGVITSSGFKATVSFGAPSPRGKISSSSYEMRVAPTSP